MAFPKNSEIDNVLLQVLVDLGGHARPQDVYPRVAEFFPQLTPEDLDARLPSSAHAKKWWNMVQWAKDRLQKRQGIDGTPNRFEGEWEITQTGRELLLQNPPVRHPGPAHQLAETTAPTNSTIQETPASAPLLSGKTFELLELLHAQPTKAFYNEHKDEFKTHLETPLAQLFQEVAKRMPSDMAQLLEMENRILARISKNDYGQGGAWDFLWGAFYPKGGKRLEDAQLYITVNHEGLKYGFSIADYGKAARQLFASNLKEMPADLAAKLSESLASCGVVYGEHDDGYSIGQSGVAAGRPNSLQEWIKNLSQYGPTAKTYVPKEQIVSMSGEELAENIADLFAKLFPLFLMSTQDHPFAQPPAFSLPKLNSRPMQRNVEEHLEAFKKDAPAWFAKATFVRNYFEFFRAFFSREQLEKAEWPDIQKMGEHLHCFQSMALAKANALGKPNHPIEHYRKSFIYLAHGPGEPAERIRRFCEDAEYRLDYFGKSAVSELVGYLFPEQFMFVNARDKFATEFLGINVEKLAGGDLIGELEAFSCVFR